MRGAHKVSEIEINDLSFSYDANKYNDKSYVLKNINLSLVSNQSVGIIGANGVGKSTFLRILVGLLPSFEGEIIIDGLVLEKKNINEIRAKLGYVFQDSDSQLFMNTVYDDVAFGPRSYNLSEKEVDERTIKALEKVGILDIAKRPTYKISGGQKKLAAIATILSMGTDTILMDEPSAALDPENRERLINVLNELEGTKLLASHDLDFIYDTCERVILFSDKKIVYDGPTRELLKDKYMLERYGLRLPLSFRFISSTDRRSYGNS